MADQKHHDDPIDRATEILQTQQKDSVRKATEILAASRTGDVSKPVAEAMGNAEGSHTVRRRSGGWWPMDPLIVTTILMAIAVGTLAIIVAMQASATSDRAAVNQDNLNHLSRNVSGLAGQLKSLESTALLKDRLNDTLLTQNEKFREYLLKHHINPNSIAGPPPKVPKELLGGGVSSSSGNGSNGSNGSSKPSAKKSAATGGVGTPGASTFPRVGSVVAGPPASPQPRSTSSPSPASPSASGTTTPASPVKQPAPASTTTPATAVHLPGASATISVPLPLLIPTLTLPGLLIR